MGLDESIASKNNPDGVDGKMAKKAFGGYTINFASVKNDTLGNVFGAGSLTPSEMTKKLWSYVKRKGLSSK